mmetsp:Transcript_97047/g.296606  ORF Transcript_97047/g.296606 Transcript_97047/m.296606 type:complete len:209 (+) Transcript_97047:2240-2866(+)
MSFSQALVQSDTSLALLRGQGLPQWFGRVSTARCRVLWPPQSVHSLHSLHEPHSQSWQTTGSHGSVLQGAVTDKSPSQGAPPYCADCTTFRDRPCWPPPHGAVQLDHSLQSLTLQSCGALAPQSSGAPSAIPGLHGSTTLSAVVRHGAPLPEAYSEMWRLRSRTPKHVQLHWDQSLQSDSRHSRSWTHEGKSSHTLNSSRRPLAGSPQ